MLHKLRKIYKTPSVLEVKQFEVKPIKDDRTYLKIKLKNLADEARTIRKEEAKLSGMDKWKLQHHRKTIVRNAARRTLLAYQIIRGKDWQSSAYDKSRAQDWFNDWKEVTRMVKKYGDPSSIERLEKIKS